MFSPGVTVAGLSVLVTERSASPAPTVVGSVSVLLAASGSPVALATVTVLEIVEPGIAAALALTIRVKVAVAPAASVGLLEVTVPPALPTAGSMLVQPAGSTNETNVVPGGITSVSETVRASLGPLLVTMIV